MIARGEIIDGASTLSLLPQVVEKDYALGWVLYGISQHHELAETWIFKGGTCLKKCFFETYRFSEDLDFTITNPEHIDQGFLNETFVEIAEWIYDRTGLELPPELHTFEIYANPRGRSSCQGKLSYRGPIAPRSGGLPRIKLDLTADEHVALAPVPVPIFHPYSDEPEDGIHILAYAYEEAFAEKIRALAERTRPRDLYDVINLYRNEEARPSPSVLLDVLRQKCEFKGISTPHDISVILPHRDELAAAWDHMLRRQLPDLVPIQPFWDTLPELFAWLESGITPEVPASIQLSSGDTVIREHTLHLSLSGMAQSYLEVIRFAAANRMCVDLLYGDQTRRIEPYSLRRSSEGNIILHAHDLLRNAHRSYRFDRIQDARITSQIFVPRYAVELNSRGRVTVRPSASRSVGSSPRLNIQRPIKSGYDRRYVYECPACKKRFYRKRRRSQGRRHRDNSGYRCSGRPAYLGMR